MATDANQKTLDKLKAEFVSVASHELKTPINVAIGYLQLIDEGIYGLPDLEHRGVKIAFDAHGVRADPETMDRSVDAASVARAREVLQRHLPALADAPLLETRVCLYENTTDGHFLLDRLPGHDHVWIAGGGSGHGFKHGPAVGQYVADLVEEQIEPDPMFQLAGRPPRQRAVY